jgi:hypothetical protein
MKREGWECQRLLRYHIRPYILVRQGNKINVFAREIKAMREPEIPLLRLKGDEK